MAAPLKCPNLGCPFLFDPMQVPPGAVIACPRCGLRFTLGVTPPANTGYAAPTGYGAPPAPPETRSEFRGDLFESSTDESVDRPAEPGRKRPGKKPNAGEETPRVKGHYGSLKSILVAAGIVFGIAAVGFGIVILSRVYKDNRNTVETDMDLKFPDLNLQFQKPAPESGWTKHDATRMSFNAALFGYVNGDENAPAGWIVGDARRSDHAVTPADLRERVTELLDKQFDNVTEAEEAREEPLCGQPAMRFLYRASDRKTGDTMILEVHALANKAIGIWVFSWAAERDFAGLASAFQTVRSGLHIAKANDPNIEVPTGTKTHRSKSGLFTLKDSDGLWTKKEPATSLDANGTLWLRGTPKSAGGRNKPSTVDLVVVEIEPEGDPKQQALELVKKSLPEGEPAIEEMTGEPTGDPPAGEMTDGAIVTRLKVKYRGADSSVNKLVVFSAVASGGKLVVVYANCQWKDLPYWERRLMQIVGSLAPRTK